MPEDSCQFLYRCTGCGQILRPKQGDCCVYCSYGSVRCPPKQLEAQKAWPREAEDAGSAVDVLNFSRLGMLRHRPLIVTNEGKTWLIRPRFKR